MERALSMAQTQLVHRGNVARTPPMAYVEEVFLEEPIQAPPEHLLFTVPDNWQPPSDFREEAFLAATEEQQARDTEEFPTCYIEEEIPEELVSQEVAPAAGHTSDKSMESDQNEEAGMEQQREAAPGEAEENRPGGMTREGGTVLMPPPISFMQEQGRVPPPFFHPEHLELLFDLWGQMVDQVHHGTLMSQRLDMLYDAFSNAPVGQRCPTCAQPFVMPARAGAQDNDVDMATSEATG
jgi:hypothetical protein